jgi:hypothetical protein
LDRTRFTLAAFAIGSALAIAGCGGSSSKSSAITKSQFVSKANAICAAGNQKTSAAAAKLGNNPSKSQILNYATGVLIPSIQSQIDAIRALGAPPGDQATVSNFMDLAQADLNKLKGNPTLIVTGGPALFHDFAVKAHAYGLTQCASQS